MKKIFLYLSISSVILLFSGGCFVTTVSADVKIIINKSVESDSITIQNVKMIFLGEMIKWDNGKKIKFAILKNDIHKEFVNTFLEMTPARFVRHWRKLVFLGKNTLPKSFDTEEELVKYISETNNAIGYVSPSKQVVDNVRILKMVTVKKE